MRWVARVKAWCSRMERQGAAVKEISRAFGATERETIHLIKMGTWSEEMETWIRQNPTATEQERLAEARRLVLKYRLT
jgi:hypothetical protein